MNMADVYWRRACDVFTDLPTSEPQNVALDTKREATSEVDKYIGGVQREENGPQQGTWFWTVAASFPGPIFPCLASGNEAERGDAGRRVAESYERMLRFYCRC